MSSISFNIPAAGLGSRPVSIISTTTLDEGGFNEPYPEIKAKLKPQVDNSSPESSSDEPIRNEREIVEDSRKIEQPDPFAIPSVVSDSVEPLYAVPYKPNKQKIKEQTSISSQKSVNSDIMYDNKSNVVTNSVLAEIESQESFEKALLEIEERCGRDYDDNGADNMLYNSSSSKDSEVILTHEPNKSRFLGWKQN